MEKKLEVLNMKVITATFLVVTYIILFFSAVPVIAADYDFKFSDDSSLQTSLLQFKDKSVEISLKSGEQMNILAVRVDNSDQPNSYRRLS